MVKSIPTYQSVFQPKNKTEHNSGDPWLKMMPTDKLTHENKLTPTQGDTTAWSDYAKLTTTNIKGVGVHSKKWEDGSAYCSWGSSGSKHTEIIRIGEQDNSCWNTNITGLGFEVFRHRTDSSTFNNDNANQHCIFVKRFGFTSLKRYGGDIHSFWSSPVLATSGEAKNSTFAYEGGVGTYEFYQVTNLNWNRDPDDWCLNSFYINLASRDVSKPGTATTKVYIYNLRFYYDYGNGNHRIVRSAFRPKSERTKLIIN